MATVGISGKLDVTKILKEHLFDGAKGKYLDITMFVNLDEKDQYDNNGMITQSWKDQQKGEGPILGNCKVFWRDDGTGQQSGQQKDYRGHSGSNQPNPTTQSAGGPGPENDIDDIPFRQPPCLMA